MINIDLFEIVIIFVYRWLIEKKKIIVIDLRNSIIYLSLINVI